VLDAYCPHLGAHIAYGGTVSGDDIVCPFHGWRFDCRGCNVEIPYSTRLNRAQRIRTWSVREVGPLVLVWYDALGREPFFELPTVPEFAEPDRYPAYPHCVRRWERVALQPQFVAENGVDSAHQRYVHGAPEVSTIEFIEDDGYCFRSHHRIQHGNKGRSTWLTSSGELFDAYLDAQVCGLGLVVARFSVDESVHIQSQTPIDREGSAMHVTILTRREPGDDGDKPSGAAARRFAYEMRQVENDLVIWEHQRFVDPAPFPPEEVKAYRRFRRWAHQFYPEIRPVGRELDLDAAQESTTTP
jgi:hypothetical protein